MKYDRFSHMYKYKGWYYEIEEEWLEDNRKSYHLAIDEKFGCSVMIPVSPYHHHPIPEKFFTMWIDMGMPDRDKMGGVTPKHYNAYYEKWALEQLEKALELESM
jgi:hypothetical protein